MKKETLKSLSFALIFYTLLVILWGAWVRISHSGDGCGDTWPLCQGHLIPEAEQKKTWVEYAHRLMSGFFGIYVLFLYFQSRKVSERGSPIRRWAFWSFVFTITEALLGAKLVLFKLVGTDDSPFRAFVMALHQVNSLLLMGAVTLLWWAYKSPQWIKREESPLQDLRIRSKKVIGFFIAGLFLIAMSGAVASLAATLFPSVSLLEGLRQDVAMESHFLLRLRGIHPLLGILVGGSIAFTAFYLVSFTKDPIFQNRSKHLGVMTSVAIAIGIVTLMTLSPKPLKLIHLTMAHAVWVHMVLWGQSFFYKNWSL